MLNTQGIYYFALMLCSGFKEGKKRPCYVAEERIFSSCNIYGLREIVLVNFALGTSMRLVKLSSKKG